MGSLETLFLAKLVCKDKTPSDGLMAWCRGYNGAGGLRHLPSREMDGEQGTKELETSPQARSWWEPFVWAQGAEGMQRLGSRHSNAGW